MMKNIFTQISIVLFIQFMSSVGYAQDVIFSSPENAQLIINPALAGCNNSLQGSIIHRDQWKHFGGSYSSTLAAFDVVLPRTILKNGSCLATGLDFYSDNSGASKFNTTSAKANLAYHLMISPFEKLSIGVYAGYLGFSSNVDNSRWGTQYDGMNYNNNMISGEIVNSSQKNNLDVGMGAILSSNSNLKQKNPTFQIGLSFYHLNRPSISFYSDSDSKLPIRMSSFYNLNLPIGNGKGEIKPSVYLQIQGRFMYLLAGSMYSLDLNKGRLSPVKNVSAGLFYRSSGAIVTRASYQMSNWNFGLSFEVAIGHKFGIAGGRGASEVSLKYIISKKSK